MQAALDKPDALGPARAEYDRVAAALKEMCR
jgi:hypothetical protein